MLGGTSPLTGPAAAYASVARGAKAYLDSVNARGGVARRKFDYKIVDDAYNPAQTVQATRQLVESDNVFAIFNSLGTEHNQAIRDYLNQAKVPQLFVATGATTFGRDARATPGRSGSSRATRPRASSTAGTSRGRRGTRGYGALTERRLRQGSPRRPEARHRALEREDRREETYDVTAPDVQSQIGSLKASRANVLAIFATPKFAIQSYVFANRLNWRPLIVNNSVSGASNIMVLASEGGKNKAVNGSITLNFLKDPTDPKWRRDAGIRQYRSIMSRYAKGANVNDVYHVYGMAVAHETVSLFRRLGANPTRAGLMARARSITSAGNPFLLPGVSVKTGRGDGFPIQQGQLQRGRAGSGCRSAGSGARNRL